jgi:hypothetical protein
LFYLKFLFQAQEENPVCATVMPRGQLLADNISDPHLLLQIWFDDSGKKQ